VITEQINDDDDDDDDDDDNIEDIDNTKIQ